MQGYMEARESPDRFSTLYELFVFDAGHKVGTLTFDATQDTFGFVYDPSWVSRPDSYPLSPHIPLRGKVRAVTIRRFVENLLPEGQALDVAASAWGCRKATSTV